MRRDPRRRRFGRGRYEQNIGKAGVIYVLENEVFREDHYKIGCSTRAGAVRAAELNRQASTAVPGAFRCVFEHRTKDCGSAEQEIFRALASHRRAKSGQEYFHVKLAHAKETILRVCEQVDARIARLPRPESPAPLQERPNAAQSLSLESTSAPVSPAHEMAPGNRAKRMGHGVWILVAIALIGVWWYGAVEWGAPPRATVSRSSDGSSPYSPAPEMRRSPADGNASQAAITTASSARRPFRSEEEFARQLHAAVATEIATLRGDDRDAIEAVCASPRQTGIRSEHDRCIAREIVALRSGIHTSDSRGISASDVQQVEAECRPFFAAQGAARYVQCRASRLLAIRNTQNGIGTDTSILPKKSTVPP